MIASLRLQHYLQNAHIIWTKWNIYFLNHSQSKSLTIYSGIQTFFRRPIEVVEMPDILHPHRQQLHHHTGQGRLENLRHGEFLHVIELFEGEHSVAPETNKYLLKQIMYQKSTVQD